MSTADNTPQRDLEAENKRLRLLAAIYRDSICESFQCPDCPLTRDECRALYEDESPELEILEFATKLVNSFANTNRCSADCQFRTDACEEIAPNTDNGWCEIIDQARKLGLTYDMNTRRERADERTSEELRATNRRLMDALNAQRGFFARLEKDTAKQLNELNKVQGHTTV